MVIPSVLERIIDRIQVGRKTVNPRRADVAPGIVGIGADLYAVFIIYRNDVPLQVPLKPEGIEFARGHAFCAVLHPDRSTVSVVIALNSFCFFKCLFYGDYINSHLLCFLSYRTATAVAPVVIDFTPYFSVVDL